MKAKRILALLLTGSLVVGATSVFASAEEPGKKFVVSEPTDQNIVYITQEDGPTLGYSLDSGIEILEVDGYAFKDLNGDGELNVYEDWRRDTEDRAKDLANIMINAEDGVEHIAGLMLYSSHQTINSDSLYDNNSMTGGGKTQAEFLEEDNMRHVLVTTVKDTETAVRWNNNLQAFVEGLGFGIPANNSSDPRHSVGTSGIEYNIEASGEISLWPSSIGMAATFDPDLVQRFGEVASAEYRAIGISTALSPQIDLATEPRWNRANGTFGEDPQLATDMAKAYVDGFQTTEGVGWGDQSVNAMVKHWPSGGAEEAGRDGHYGYGKFAVYPGENYDDHLSPFVNGAFQLDGGTDYASAVMPYYTISVGFMGRDDITVANSYSRYIIGDLLRDEYGYDGVVCTDWGITDTPTSQDSFLVGKAWGVEEGYTVEERHYMILAAGVDQFGGNDEMQPVLDAYEIMVDKDGLEVADRKFEESARRLLTNIFNTNLFENPYLDIETSQDIVGNPDFMAEGFDAQLKSVVMLKNKDNIISENGLEGKKVYVQDTDRGYVFGGYFDFETMEFVLANMPSETYGEARDTEFYESYFGDALVDDIDDADVVIMTMDAPNMGDGYSKEEGYLPLTLQYGSYTAVNAREESIGQSDTYLDNGIVNRTYNGKTFEHPANVDVMDDFNATIEAAGDKPVIVFMKAANPMVFSEVEPFVDGIVLGYSVQTQAAMDIITGQTEPSGLLPMQQPANMETVEEQYEDVPHDMECYEDEDGNVYDFGFGLDWEGQIEDERTEKYVDGNGGQEPDTDEETEPPTEETEETKPIETDPDTKESETKETTKETTKDTSGGKTPKGKTPPKTGDANVIIYLVSILSLSVMGLIIFRKKRA